MDWRRNLYCVSTKNLQINQADGESRERTSEGKNTNIIESVRLKN